MKVIYLTPDFDNVVEFEAMSTDEQINIAKNDCNAYLLSLSQFQTMFNNEGISDFGFIYFVNV